MARRAALPSASVGGVSFDDLLDANRKYAESFPYGGFDGIARAGVAMVTCMDSRIDPLGMIGIEPGDAKILRNPGGRATNQALIALVLGVNLLRVNRILLVQHTRCAMASASEKEIIARVSEASSSDASWMSFGVIEDQNRAIRHEVHRIETHPLIAGRASVGGFLYDVDTGLLNQIV